MTTLVKKLHITACLPWQNVACIKPDREIIRQCPHHFRYQKYGSCCKRLIKYHLLHSRHFKLVVYKSNIMHLSHYLGNRAYINIISKPQCSASTGALAAASARALAAASARARQSSHTGRQQTSQKKQPQWARVSLSHHTVKPQPEQ